MKAQTPSLGGNKNYLAVYIIAIVVSFIVLTLLTGIALLSASFMNLPSFTGLYLYISAVSLVTGFITAVIFYRIAQSHRLFLLGGAIVSFLCAVMNSGYILIQMGLKEQMSMIAGSGSGVASGSAPTLSELFSPLPNALLIGALIIFSFNLLYLTSFLRKEDKSMKDLLVYLYGTIAYLIIYFLVHLIG